MLSHDYKIKYQYKRLHTILNNIVIEVYEEPVATDIENPSPRS